MRRDTTAIPKTPLAFFRFILRPHWKLAVFAVVCVTIAGAGSQGTSYFFKLIVDAVQADNLQHALWWGMAYPVAVFLVQLVYRASGVTGGILTNRAGKTGMDNVSDYILHHSHGYYSDRFAGSIVNKLRNIFHAIEQTIPEMLWTHWNAAVSFTVTFILISTVDVWSGLVFLGLLATLATLNSILAPQKAVLSKANATAGTNLQAHVNDVIGNVSAVRQYTQVAHEHRSIEQLTARRQITGIRSWLYTEKMLLINSCVIFLFSLVMFWILIQRWSGGDISTGDFVLVLALISQITGLMLFLGRAFNTTAKTIGELREALDDLLIPHEIIDVPDAKDLEMVKGEIRWEDVCFRFENETVFRDFSLTIKSHERIGLVGPSGAGKSTFVSLLLRQHELDRGRIMIDDQDIATVTQSSLRANVAIVPQEPILFHRTIRENIAYSRPDARESDIELVARQAYAHDFISALPQGYDTLVGERGVKLSGGQKQRIAIARAMLKNAPILILDEATSALDSESEVVIQKALHELMRGKTVIAIAHRLSTLREMDRILVLENGVIVEEGAHNELKHSGGLYQRLWEHQAGGFVNKS